MIYQKKECVAMLLAGGQGSRLTVLTEETAKPAVPFGGKYRIIDFPLSNCVNSGIDTVGIMTQYQPLELNEYIGNGQPWGLNSISGGIHVLSPYSKSQSSEWYKGTANAIFQNLSFMERYNPDHVLILSGDHIYRMDYAEMMALHKKSGADCTIAVLEVSPEEASRFGIMETNADNKIIGFEEKPKEPKSNLASMGIYIFKFDVLKEYLTRDNEDPDSSNDFGKNIIPAMLRDGLSLYAFPFRGYWKDVGTIDSLWQANMDILGERPAMDLRKSRARVYARNYAHPSSFIEEGAKIQTSFVAEGSHVAGTVIHSVVSTGCTVEKGAVVKDSVLMPGVVVKKSARVAYCVVGEDTEIGVNAKVGDDPEFYPKNAWGITVLGKKRKVEQNAVIPPKETF